MTANAFYDDLTRRGVRLRDDDESEEDDEDDEVRGRSTDGLGGMVARRQGQRRRSSFGS